MLRVLLKEIVLLLYISTLYFGHIKSGSGCAPAIILVTLLFLLYYLLPFSCILYTNDITPDHSDCDVIGLCCYWTSHIC
jgi:hypothetical protein